MRGKHMFNSTVIIVLIIAFIIHGIIWGKATNKVLQYRGYFYDDWFIWGFLFGIATLLVAMSRPDNNANVIKKRAAAKQAIITNPNTEWKCRKCKMINPPYTGTCSCGNTREENDAPLRAMQERREAELRAMQNQKDMQDTELDNLLTLSAYKDLLDKGVITQQDFEEKRKELLP